ncbi:MAG TPA: two-component regulator propeller domain-containing protein [Cytophagales bacterium]|nr:two-component regulator propeller domain-containing protein [Cytophagales bacterium]
MQGTCKWFCIFFIITLHFAFAQKNIKLQQVSSENGLSQNTINCIYQDHKGFLWFGTHNGLNKYDAYTFTVFKNIEKDSSSISSNDIYSIYEDSQNNLWIGTSQGLALFKHTLGEFVNYDFASSGNYLMHPVWSIFPSKDDNKLWLGGSGGLFLFDKRSEKFQHYKINDSIQNVNSIGSVLEDSKGDLWIGSLGGGLWKFDKKTHQFVRPDNYHKKNDEVIRCLLEDSQGNIWIGTDEGILSKYNFQHGSFTYYSDLKGRFPIRSMIENKKGEILIGTDKGGVYFFDKRRNKLLPFEYEKENGNDVVRSLFEDRKGNLWIGTYNGGAFLNDNLDATFNYLFPYSNIKDLNENNSVLTIFEDQSKSLWVGTDGGGLIEFRKGEKVNSYRKNTEKGSISDNIILCIDEGRQDQLFLGTYSNGLSVLDKGTGKFTNYKHTKDNPSGLNNNSIWALYHDVNDVLWIGTNNGGLNLFYTKSGKFKYFTNSLKNPGSICSNTIRSIFKDSRNKFWIGTVSGLDLFNEKDSTFSHFFHDPSDKYSISNNNVLSIFEDSQSNLWFGTHGGGINKYIRDKNQFITYNENDGLHGNIVYGIVDDDKGNLWLSTNKGLFRFNPATEEFKSFDTSSGLHNSQFNIGAHFKNHEGALFFGSTNGVCSFFPQQIKMNTYVPPVVITDFMLFNKSVDKDGSLKNAVAETKEIVLDHTQSVFSFTFAALNYTHSHKNQYAYKLEPFDENWNYVGTRRSATYTNLEPGKYVFKVKGSNNDNVWNDTPTTINLIITPPYWKTVWFKISIVLLSLLIIYLGYRFKVRGIKNQQIILKRLVDKKAREIEEKNNQLYETERQNALLLQQKLNHELTNKSKELTQYILLIIQKNQLLDELKKKVKETVKTSASGKPADYRNILKTINYNFTPDKEWTEFNLNFGLIHQGFAERLRIQFPELTNHDLRLCALYRIYISSRQISEVMGISLTTLKMARYRLRKKLNLCSEEDLSEFLKKI